MRWLIALILVLLLAPLARAQTAIVDGDTIRLNGTTVRLHGVDAPELSQTCPNGFLAGAYAAGVLRGLTDNHTVTCHPKTTDRYGRTVAVCWVDGLDLGAEMVRQGMAWSFTRYSRDYELQEAYAKAAGLGVHGAGCQLPWDYRKERR